MTHREVCSACGTEGAFTDDSGAVEPHVGRYGKVCLGPRESAPEGWTEDHVIHNEKEVSS